ncbi:hypothetical protein TRFO_37564 [Tritrichomonas foetus]|uniref:Uncharacterized protein n=1 Tax=Tritrichomonas foetus TaxID=1144522 RepID=A0A1J4JC76_9EUKA|nr:hypothetical protein TRFO_37564 [Tritrichomonas foetus]|eukprot:OHS96265.1 hypothetical protein TRFO_37564 [Tritrichomonas foetus]
MLAFWKPKNSHEKELSEKIDKAKKTNTNANVIKDLCAFVPEYNNIILYKLAPKLTENLKNPANSNEVASATIELIKTMIEQADILMAELTSGSRSISEPAEKREQRTPDYVPYPAFLKQSKFLEYIFEQCKVYDDRVMYIIEKFYAFEPIQFVKWILTQKNLTKSSLINIFNLAAKTQNIRASRIVHFITVSNNDVKKMVTPIIKPLLRKFPVSIVIDLMVASNEIKETIPSLEFEEWLLTHDSFTLSDIDIVTGFYKVIWLSETAVRLLLRSGVPEKMSDTYWIASREAQEFDIDQEVINAACKAMKPDFDFRIGSDGNSTRDPYLFVRIFIVSLANPEKVTLEVQRMVCELVKDKSEFVAAAATQCVIYWMIRFNYKIKRPLIYRLAASAVEEGVPTALKYLYMGALHVCGQQFDIATTILQTEEHLRFQAACRKDIVRRPWCFPHFKKNINKIFKIKLIDYNQAADVICYISGYLCDVDEEKPTSQEVVNDENNEVQQVEQ